MQKSTATLDRAGRVLIPAAIRKELGLGEGEELIIRMKNGSIEMYTLAEAIRRAQEYCKQFKKSGESVVDELLEDRRREVPKELAG